MALLRRGDDAGGDSRRGTEAEPLGYAVLLLSPVGATWELGDRVGEIESLAVAPAARGRGVGSALLVAARERFRGQGIEWWRVAVVEANEGAVKLYERAGFGPYYRHLLGRVEPGPSGEA